MDNRKIIKKRILVITIITLIITASVVLSICLGEKIIAFVTNAEAVRNLVDKYPFKTRLIFLAITITQIILAFIPGEPVELAAGYAFGAFEGTVLCLIGAMIGSTIDFMIVKLFGMKIVKVFFSDEQIGKLKFLKASKKRDFWMFMIMFIPGTPKDALSYVAGLTDISLLKWILIATFARLPSVITSCVGASALGENRILFAVIVFGITLLISLAGWFIYNKICEAHDKKA
jgi:uncharacterized membrane protein YdjX (TVP38/TMEM64 family)